MAQDKAGHAAGDALEADGARRQLDPAGIAAPKSGDSPKPHGDTLGVVAGHAGEAASPEPAPGDSPKPHGDPLEHAVRSGKG